MSSTSSRNHLFFDPPATLRSRAFKQIPHSFVPASPYLSMNRLQKRSVWKTKPQVKQKSPNLSYLQETTNTILSILVIFFLRISGFLASIIILTLIYSLHIDLLFFSSYGMNSPKKSTSCFPILSFMKLDGRS